MILTLLPGRRLKDAIRQLFTPQRKKPYRKAAAATRFGVGFLAHRRAMLLTPAGV